MLAADGEPTEWLVVASRRATFAHGLTKPVAQAAAPLLAATARLSETERVAGARDPRGAARRPAGPRGADAHALAARAATFGLDLAMPARVVVRGVDEALERGSTRRPPHLALDARRRD